MPSFKSNHIPKAHHLSLILTIGSVPFFVFIIDKIGDQNVGKLVGLMIGVFIITPLLSLLTLALYLLKIVKKPVIRVLLLTVSTLLVFTSVFMGGVLIEFL